MNNRVCIIMSGIVTMFLLLVITSCRQNEPKGHLSTTAIGPVPDPVNITVTPNGRHTIFVMPNGNKQRVVFDGVAGPEFEGVYVERSLVLSSDEKRTGYIIATNQPAPNGCKTCGPPGKWRVVIDNQFGPEYEKILRIAFSHDAKKVAYAAMKKTEDGSTFWTVVVDGKEAGHYNAISKLSPLFNLDGKQVVSVARKENQKSVVVVNNAESKEYDYIGYGIPFFSPDGKHMAYSARDYSPNLTTVVFDGKASPKYNAIPERSLVFSADSKHFAYGAQTGNEWQVVTDGMPQEKYAQVDNIQYSPDGKYLTYKAKKGDKWMVVVNSKEGTYQDSIMNGFPVFSPDGKNIAYGFKKNGKWNVVVEQVDIRKNINGRFLVSIDDKGYDEIISCTFSPDSKHLSYIVREGDKKKAVIDGQAGDGYDDIVPNVIYSADSKRMAYLARFKKDGDKKRLIVLDGKAGSEYDGILNENLSFIVFSPDSKHVAYAASMDGKWNFIIDEQVMAEGYDTICNLVTSLKDGFESMVINNKVLYRVKWNFDK
ncbi:MAG: WD40-like Beta Propeller Repeat [Mucilaginibacter sp.]|nr:WD40-like Beta Propeller Repeat [Mucilaginibacter sp.]